MKSKSVRSVLFLATTAIFLPMVMATSCPTSAVPVTYTRPPGIYVTNQNDSVTVFALDASGNAAPLRTITGSSTELSLPIGIGMDTQNRLYVANRTGFGVTVYPADADGDVAPIKTLTDPNMGSAEGLAVGPGDDIFVSTCPFCGTGGGGQVAIFHFPNNATQSDYVIGGATNANTGMTNPGSIALDADRNIFIGNSFGGTVEVFASGSVGDVFPIRSLTPSVPAGGTSANLQSIALGNQGLFVAVPGAVIQEYTETATGGTPPSTTILSSATLPIQYPGGMAVDDTVTPPVIYLADYTADALYVIQTAGIAPFLTVDHVTTIEGSATKLDRPCGVLVIKD